MESLKNKIMFIFLDESYNLKNRTKPQFVSINGFAVLNVRALFKKWKECRYSFTGSRRIHAVDSAFNKLRLKALKLVKAHDLTLLTAFQIIQEIPFQKDKSYFVKGELNFEKIYLGLLKSLFGGLNLGEYRKVVIVIDSRKHKAGILGKREFLNKATEFLKQKYPETTSTFEMQSSSSNILLELTDFISNTFYRAYVRNDQKFFGELSFKMLQIKNPL